MRQQRPGRYMPHTIQVTCPRCGTEEVLRANTTAMYLCPNCLSSAFLTSPRLRDLGWNLLPPINAGRRMEWPE